ncbi:hypothetical protein Q787_03740 [Ornithobacterium rhinotracheale H06-030791]|nr:TetR/AcrR family transcriptional regulator [Ornithobacterium rhinotracheale]AIQ00388.1 hypothetical protein Q785_03865 [Ornithobacterium rhinotracheale ORT-UMN 88]KGB67292.1 hypothetical protein Q787_03740 [Ornithobacterium rhinotracheale H06-030791]MBN3662019.1 TetR/AcrR family transcriptional regulator [Ornithobacterium rhinotracheale]MCK0194605.1 TetR/AcrR family transcriptional regulator [Ornithobacterium rhinotracheale]
MEMKEKVLNKAKELFCQFGYKTITMDEVANQLSVSKKILYEIYDSKSKLVEEVVGSLQKDIDREIENSFDKRYNAIEQIYATISQVEKVFGVLNSRKLNWELQKYYPKIRQSLDINVMERMKKYLYRNIQQGIAEGLYRPEIDMQFMFYFFWGITQNKWGEEIYPEHKFDFKEVEKKHMEYVLRIMATPKGVAVLEKIINPEK